MLVAFNGKHRIQSSNPKPFSINNRPLFIHIKLIRFLNTYCNITIFLFSFRGKLATLLTISDKQIDEIGCIENTQTYFLLCFLYSSRPSQYLHENIWVLPYLLVDLQQRPPCIFNRFNYSGEFLKDFHLGLILPSQKSPNASEHKESQKIIWKGLEKVIQSTSAIRQHHVQPPWSLWMPCMRHVNSTYHSEESTVSIGVYSST